MKNKMKIQEFIERINDLDENLDVVFECSITDLSTESVCEIINSEDIEDKVSTIPIYQIIDIIDNIKQQIKEPSYNEIIKAIIFYVENDAFIQL